MSARATHMVIVPPTYVCSPNIHNAKTQWHILSSTELSSLCDYWYTQVVPWIIPGVSCIKRWQRAPSKSTLYQSSFQSITPNKCDCMAEKIVPDPVSQAALCLRALSAITPKYWLTWLDNNNSWILKSSPEQRTAHSSQLSNHSVSCAWQSTVTQHHHTMYRKVGPNWLTDVKRECGLFSVRSPYRQKTSQATTPDYYEIAEHSCWNGVFLWGGLEVVEVLWAYWDSQPLLVL